MKKIILLGAGLSTSTLIRYLLKTCKEQQWELVVGDIDVQEAEKKIAGHEAGIACQFDLSNQSQTEQLINQANLVISMLPASYHPQVAKMCGEIGKHLLTASYATDEMMAYDQLFKDKGLILLTEMGLDPGIDHMSAMKVINQIREQGGVLKDFETFTGGLLAPSNDDNPWRYKFTWSPRNVVLAGQGVIKFLHNGRYKYIPYNKLFRRTEIVHIPGYDYFEGYANRDSLKYLDIYGLKGIQTLYRGTFRRPGFCKAWDVFVKLGATDDSYQMENVSDMTHRQFINSFLYYNPHDSVELKIAHYLNLDMESEEMYKLKWLGIFEDEPVGLESGTPAQILENILRKKWTMDPQEKDMIVMWHKFEYEMEGKMHQIQSHMVVIGEGAQNTAMAKTVGLPLGIAAKLLLTDKINLKGLQIPIQKEIYQPVLRVLEKEGIIFEESVIN
ncbi:MAG: saccharopine dehydrogenase NADP-binding domain-containing protein [Bacteroidetes bacterium]|nr:saccharopine dehydrogenase NADP-binding domain-containing protein [Bacteroidota bacterium]